MKRLIFYILLFTVAGLPVTLPLLAAPTQPTTPTVMQAQSQAQSQIGGSPSGVSPGMPPANAQQPMTDIHDIRNPIQVGVNPAIYYWSIGGVFAVLIIGLLVFLWRRWRARKPGLPPEIAATVYETPEEEALRRLTELGQNTSLTPVEYYFLLSVLFRRWIQRRFNIGAPEMTTEELLPAMTRAKLNLPMLSDIKSFFLFADQVKFAKAGCEAQTMKQHYQLVRDIVERTSTSAMEDSVANPADRPAETLPAKKTEGRA